MVVPDAVRLIEEIVKSSGLPADTWDGVCPVAVSTTKGYDFKYWQHMGSCHLPAEIRINQNILSTMEALSTRQILNLAVLLRTPDGLTNMVSVAEAIKVTLDETHVYLMAILLQAIGVAMNQSRNEKLLFTYLVMWQEEISYGEFISMTDRRQDIAAKHKMEYQKLKSFFDPASRSDKATTGLVALRERNKQLESQLTAMEKWNQELESQLTDIGQRNRYLEDRLYMDIELSNSQPRSLSRFAPFREHESAETAAPTTSTSDRKFYKPLRAGIKVKSERKEWFLCTEYVLEQAFARLIAWLHLLLGGTDGGSIQEPLKCIRLRPENELLFQKRDRSTTRRPATGHCWRNKIMSGNVLIAAPMRVDKVGTDSPNSFSPPRDLLDHNSQDGLRLTAAALWSLFDNSLERVHNCRCTFRSEGGEYIQCLAMRDEWFVWHVFTSQELCDGRDCNQNVQIALREDEVGRQLTITSPCILGWSASARDNPFDVLWKKLEPTEDFKNKILTKYAIKELQLGAQLSVPAVVSPQFGFGATFSKRNYEIANSVDYDSALALAQAAAVVVLLYDEAKGVHLTLDGADLIELICLQELRAASYDTTILPAFEQPSALTRVKTWQTSSFVPLTKINIPGNQLVRQAAKKVLRLLEVTKDAFRKDQKFLYWLLQDVLNGHSALALKAPRLEHVTWHQFASTTPPLIFAVGSLEARFLASKESPWRLITSKGKTRLEDKPRVLRHFARIFSSGSKPGGLLADAEVVKRWMTQCETSHRLSLKCTHDRITCGDEATDIEPVYEVTERDGKTVEGFGCVCEPDKGTRCLHYIQ